MSFSPIKGSAQIEKQYKRYLSTMFKLNDPDYQQQFSAQLHEQKMFVAGPYLDAHDNFSTGRTTRQLVREGVLPEFFLKYGFHHDRPLYTHQEQALIKALQGHNIIVSTGTGSGKTESFLMPILTGLAEEKERGALGAGVRALLIYPMNALANDQMERLRDLTKGTPDITFGCYTGQTQEEYKKALAEYEKLNKRKPQKNELISREQMKETPPHILVTNYAMLEYLMVRPKDSTLFAGGTWRYVVLDEAHVYRGSTGIEVSMLLRRLKATLNNQSLQYFLTSATLGNEGENEAVASFAHNLCDEPFYSGNVIRAVRTPVPKPEQSMSVPAAIYREITTRIDAESTEEEIGQWLLENYPEFHLDPKQPLFDLIRRDIKYWELRTALKKPTPIYELSAKLHLSAEELELLVATASFSESDGVRLLDARYHTFLRATDSVFITLPPNKKLFLTRTLSDHCLTDGQNYKVFEVNSCNNCHAIYLVGLLDSSTNCLNQSNKPGAKDIFFLGKEVSNTDEDGLQEESQNTPGVICALCGHFRRTNVRSERSCEHGCQYEVPVVKLKAKGTDRKLKKCVCCEAVNNYGILRPFFTGQEAVTSVIATSLFNVLPAKTSVKVSEVFDADDFGFSDDFSVDYEKEANQAKQFLCFSDSRQASAFFSSYLDTSYRQLLYRRMTEEQVRLMSHSMSLPAFCEDLSVLFERYHILAGTGYRYEKESWKAVLSEAANLNSDTSLPGMGLMAIGLESGLFSANPRLGLSAAEVNSLFHVMVSSLINDLAISIPVAMTEEDREFYSYGSMGAYYLARSEDIAVKSFIPKSNARSNKRKDYLKRVLEAKQYSMEDEMVDRLMLALWKQLEAKGILVYSEKGYQLNSEKLYIHRPTQWYRCSKCKKITAYNIDGICPTYHCQGDLQSVDPKADLEDNHYFRLSQDMEMRPLRVKEHTAQLSREKAYEYQQDFKDKKIDVLSCSTTFEMGVDVGSLETVFMRNMPPKASNYAQRAGRAGRSKKSAAFALTFCNRSSHDFSYFQHPSDMISGSIHAPHFNILNEKIAIRHLYASALALFWKRKPGYFSTVEKMASMDFGSQGKRGFEQFSDYLRAKPAELREYAKQFLPKHLYDAFDCENFGWVHSLLDKEEGVLSWAVSEYDAEVGQLEEARQQAFKERKSTGYYEQRLRNYRNESILSFLSRKNVMPKYGFPVDSVGLAIVGKKADQQFGVELERDLAMAISEYAPGSQVVANGQLFTGRYIRKLPSIMWKMYDYIYCKECGSLNIQLHIEDTKEPPLKVENAKRTSLEKCKICDVALDSGTFKTFIVPSFGFEIDPSDIRKPGLMHPEKTYRTDVSYVGYRNNVEMKEVRVKNSTALMMLSEKDEMAVLNRSEFHICGMCGYGETSQSFLPTIKKEHNTPSGRKCINQWLKRFSLGYRFETDVFIIRFPEHPIAYANEAAAYSVLFALLRGIVDVLDLEDTDIFGCLQCINTHAEKNYSFIFYDTTPGGAGHMRKLQDEAMLSKAVNRANQLMKNCTCGGNDGHASCYACLRSYNNQKLHDLLDRSLAIRYFESL